jgi:hypothetical protein
MEISYLKQTEIDTAKWDYCIAKSFNGMIYAYSWYLDIVCPDWDALICGDYESVMPLTQNRKMGFDYLFQPYFTQQLGIFSSHKIDYALVESFISAIPEKFKFVEINLNKFNCISGLRGYKIAANITYELDLIHSYEKIFRKYKKNTIRNIRKAIHEKVSIVKGLKLDQVFDLVKTSGIFQDSKMQIL